MKVKFAAQSKPTARKAYKALSVVNLEFPTFREATGNKAFRIPVTSMVKAIELKADQKIVDVQNSVVGKFNLPDYIKTGAKASINGAPANATVVLFNKTVLEFKKGVLTNLYH